MKIIYNKLIPFKGYNYINICGLLFTRSKEKALKISFYELNHERIHTAQMKELYYILFYLLYLGEWIIKCFIYGRKDAYRNISFEREAYQNQRKPTYLSKRKPLQFQDYL